MSETAARWPSGQEALAPAASAAPPYARMTWRRPWLFAVLGGAGATLLCAGGFALFAPPRLLDRAATLGDARLAGSLAALFAVTCCLSRLLLLRRRLPEERVDDVLSRTQRHLR